MLAYRLRMGIMEDQTIHNKLWDLESAIGGCHPTAKEVQDPVERFNDLRVRLKYLLFDVEATRRENAYLREMLKKKHFGD